MIEALHICNLLVKANSGLDSRSPAERTQLSMFRLANFRIIETAFILFSEGTLSADHFSIFEKRAITILREGPGLVEMGVTTNRFNLQVEQVGDMGQAPNMQLMPLSLERFFRYFPIFLEIHYSPVYPRDIESQ